MLCSLPMGNDPEKKSDSRNCKSKINAFAVFFMNLQEFFRKRLKHSACQIILKYLRKSKGEEHECKRYQP